jgi:hypothetical protein
MSNSIGLLQSNKVNPSISKITLVNPFKPEGGRAISTKVRNRPMSVMHKRPDDTRMEALRNDYSTGEMKTLGKNYHNGSML